MSEQVKVVEVRGDVYRIPQRPLTVDEVAAILGVEKSVVRDRVSGPKRRMTALPKDQWHNGKCMLITPESVEQYLLTRQRRPSGWRRSRAVSCATA